MDPIWAPNGGGGRAVDGHGLGLGHAGDGGADVGGRPPRQGRGAVAARLGDGGGVDAADRAQRQARVRVPAGGDRVAAQPHAERGGGAPVG